MLYASLHGCFVEVLSRFRQSATFIAGLATIEGPPDAIAPGIVPQSWLRERAIAEAIPPAGIYVDVGRSDSLSHLHAALRARLVHYGIVELDAAAIRQSAQRRFTQEVSSYLFRQSDADGKPSFVGIAYPSRFGDEFTNWAIFERSEVGAVASAGTRPIAPDDPDFQAAMKTLGLTLES